MSNEEKSLGYQAFHTFPYLNATLDWDGRTSESKEWELAAQEFVEFAAAPLHQRIAELTAENNKWRAAYGNSDKPCMYCELSAADQAKCQSGFPGCGRADDQMMCPHFAAELGCEQTIAELQAKLDEREPWDDEANQDCAGAGGVTCPHCGHVE